MILRLTTTYENSLPGARSFVFNEALRYFHGSPAQRVRQCMSRLLGENLTITGSAKGFAAARCSMAAEQIVSTPASVPAEAPEAMRRAQKDSKIVGTNCLKLFRINKSLKKTNSKRTQNDAEKGALKTRNGLSNVKTQRSSLPQLWQRGAEPSREFDFNKPQEIVGANYTKLFRINKGLKKTNSKRTQNETKIVLSRGKTPRRPQPAVPKGRPGKAQANGLGGSGKRAN